jgi:chromosome segregation ATPase
MSGSTEKGFGTGLRAQLERKQNGVEAPAPSVEEEEPRSVSEAIAAATLQAEGVAELRTQLEAARERERELRAALSAQVNAVELEQQTARRIEELDERDAQLASSEATVAARERSAAEQLAEAEAVREAIASQHDGLAATEARASERDKQLELKLKQVKEAEAAHAKAAAELTAKAAAVAESARSLE